MWNGDDNSSILRNTLMMLRSRYCKHYKVSFLVSNHPTFRCVKNAEVIERSSFCQHALLSKLLSDIVKDVSILMHPLSPI